MPTLPPEGSSKEVYGTVEVSGAAVTISGGLGTDVHDTPAGTDVLLMGAFGQSTGMPSAVTTGDAVRLHATLNGALVINGQLPEDGPMTPGQTPWPVYVGARASDPDSPSITVSLNDVIAITADQIGRLLVAIDKDCGATFDHGSNRDIDASAEQLIAASTTCKRGVLVKADAANSGTVFLGNSDVTAGTTDATDGFPLAAGESVFIPIDNVNKVYAIGSAANQVVYWMKQ